MPGQTTLLKYANVARPKVFDLSARMAQDTELSKIATSSPDLRRAWALETVAAASESPAQVVDRYRTALEVKSPKDGYLPIRSDVGVPAGALAALARDERYRSDLKAMTRLAIAGKVTGDEALAREAGYAAQFLERLPRLPDLAVRELPAPAVLARFKMPAMPKPGKASTSARPRVSAGAPGEVKLRQARDDIAALWVIRNRYVREARAQLERGSVALVPRPPGATAPPPTAKRAAKSSAAQKATSANKRSAKREEEARQAAEREQAAAHFRALRQANAARQAKIAEFRRETAATDVASFLQLPASQILTTVPGLSKATLEGLRNRLKGYPGFKPGNGKSFCMAFEDVQSALDIAPPTPAPDPIAGIELTAPTVSLSNTVDLLGTAELIKVEERLMGYSEAEISYVENILAGEKRMRRVKTSSEFETIETETEQETTVTTSERRSTSSQSLASEVSQAVSSRFNSDVSSSASASGGGTIGVVNVQGQGSFNLGVGLGIDTSLSSTDRSEFGMEIVEAATEAVTRATQSVRSTRSRSLHETLNRYEIDNTIGTDPAHRRGVYCFLNKHLCVTETPYGVRWFLKAQLAAPGRTLLAESRARQAIAASQVEAPPEFNLSPADIHPSNYQAYVSRFRAQGVSPPPEATRHLARTYKCDQSNKASEDAQGLAKIGKAIMPIFGSYNRHLITDSLEIPEGYMVQEVRLSIDHGANGLSIPVDLPFKLGGAAVMAVPTLLAYPLIMVPVALWQTLLLASPLVYNNTDSSAVTATIGNEAQQSNYYFFEPDFLLGELLQLFGSFAGAGAGIMAEIRELIDELPNQLLEQTEDMVEAVSATAGAIVDELEDTFTSIRNALNGVNLANPNVSGLIQSLVAALTDLGTRVAARTATIPTDLFEPLNAFLRRVAQIVTDAAESAMSDLMAVLLAVSENSQLRSFSDCYGTSGSLPISFNIAAIKPSVTVNLVACVARTDRALDEWRLSTFEKLYQAHLQAVAEHQGTIVFGTPQGRSPGSLRLEEQRAIRTRVIEALNARWPVASGTAGIPMDRLNLFEHAIDWDNVSYRVFNYGADAGELENERIGLFRGIDPMHRQFLSSAWGEVMLPLSGDVVLERAMLAYFENGTTAIGADLTNDELAALWQDVISRRSAYAAAPDPIARREIVVPTDLVVLRVDDSLPTGLPTPCSP